MWFTNVVKPTHLCNLDCHYCYNEDTRNPIMTREMLAVVVRETLAYASTLGPHTNVDFVWHGGEPLLAGLSFYRDAVAWQATCADSVQVCNSIQTNGTLLNEEWIPFFRDHAFDVSLSLDGPEALHDSSRRSRSGKEGSFRRVMRGIDLLRTAGLPHGACVVVSRANQDRVDEVFDFLAREKIPFNVIPLTRSGGGLTRYEDLGLEAGEYARPWKAMFDRWFDAAPSNYVQCTDFVRKARAILGGAPTDCIGAAQCADHHISTDPDGNVYPCATLSADAEWCYGNLERASLRALMAGERATAARQREVDPHCKACKWQHICHGGCMSRAIKFYGSIGTRDYYCPSLYQIYEHIEARLRAAACLDCSSLPNEGVRDTRRPPPERQLTMRRMAAVTSSAHRERGSSTSA
jgi:uncharacterized protein